MTQREMAEILKVSTSAVSHYENETREPSEHIIVTVAKYFNVTCDYLLGMNSSSNVKLSKKASVKELITLINELIDNIDLGDKTQ